jgi:hypothetical protein
MANFTAGTSFSANDTVTNTKLNALIADASINPEYAISLNSGTIGTLSCTRGTVGTLNSTTGTITTINSTTGNIGTVAATSISATSGTIGATTATSISATSGTIGSLNSTSATIQTLTASTLSGTLTGGTYSGSLGTSANFTAGTVQTLTAGTLTGTLTGGTYTGSLGTSCNFTAGTIGTFTGTNNSTIAGIVIGTGAGGSFNTGFGAGGTIGSSTAGYNSGFGYGALRYNTSGAENTAHGMWSLYSNTTAGSNTAVGYSSQYSGGTTSFNTSIGNLSLYLNSTGTGRNTAVGYKALFTDTGIANVTALGASTTVTGSNQVQLGDSATTTYAYGAVQNRSDIRDKADVRDTTLGLEFVNQLRPVDFKWDMREYYKPEFNKDANPDIYKFSNITHDGSKKRNRYHHGLIAQEVKEVLDKNGIDFGGFQDHKISGGDDVLSIGYNELIAPMIKAIQQLSSKVDNLEAQLANK